MLKSLLEKVEKADLFLDERKTVLENLEKNVPFWVRSSLEKGARTNSECRKSEYYKLKEDKITMDQIAGFNYDLNSAIHDYELSDHVYETNMIDIHYYSNILMSLNERNALASNKFNEFKEKSLIFKLIDGFGRIG